PLFQTPLKWKGRKQVCLDLDTVQWHGTLLQRKREETWNLRGGFLPRRFSVEPILLAELRRPAAPQLQHYNEWLPEELYPVSFQSQLSGGPPVSNAHRF